MKLRLFMVLVFAVVATASAEIRQELGVDQSVDYRALKDLGPWDDRNYQLTSEDLAYLPENDQYIANVPLFYKVGVRKKHPEIGDHYPRSLYQTFLIQFGGLVVDGVWYKEGLGKYYHPVDLKGKPDPAVKGGLVDPTAEVIFAQGAETAIEYNPTNNLVAVAGVNAGGGQSMFYTNDGGVTWNFSQVNTNSCCDPTVDWSFDGSRVYQADLGDCGAGLFDLCQIRASYSTDQGVTWQPMITIDPDVTNDKEYIHVDRGATSPYQDNVYITYHKNNVMHFAKSEDMGVTWTTPQALTQGVDTGIGSDITTDSAGNIYYIYPSVDGAGLISLKSSDGGDNWDAPVQIGALRGDFDFPIPSMETREVFIYASADVDSSDNIYVAITDEAADSNGGGTGAAAVNRAEIRVFKSTDAGATWNELVKPHADDGQLNSGTPIDRFHPWLMVAENDAIHVGFYDTRHSTNRSGVDFYYNVSVDGGTSWIPAGEQRFSTETSSNLGDNFEWGDYNGLSVVMDKVIMTWTDNRAAQKNAIAGYTDNLFGGATFTTAANPTEITVCANDTNNQVNLDVNAIQGYTGTVTLSVDTGPAYVVNDSFSVNNQVPTFSSVYSFDVNGTGTTGQDTLTLLASGDDLGDITERTVDITLNYSAGVGAGATLMMPADGATAVTAQPTFNWSADANALSYLIEVATDDQFNNIVISETVNTNSFSASSDLQTSTEHFWRVTSQSPCGDTVSGVFSFTTNVAPGDCPVGTVQTDVYAFDFDGVAISSDVIFIDGFDVVEYYTEWTVDAAEGAENWALEPVGDGNSLGYQADDLASVNDTSVISPVLSLPTGVGPLTLRFWNTQNIEDQTSGTACWDGAQLLISVNGDPFTQVTDADIINDAYTGLIGTGFSNPADNQPGWCGDPLPATVFNVNVDSHAGSDVQFAFRMASDESFGRPEGWVIDNVRVTSCEAPSP